MPRRVPPRLWRAILLTILLFICLVLLLILGRQVVRSYLAVENLRRVQAGERIGVRPWMTVPYIAHTYGVPEEVLFTAIGVPPEPQNRHAPLRLIATREHQDVDRYVSQLNATIDAWKSRTPPAAPPRLPTAPRPPPVVSPTP